eukprot:6198529-Pleurochrysis_carterae.AAC.4
MRDWSNMRYRDGGCLHRPLTSEGRYSESTIFSGRRQLNRSATSSPSSALQARKLADSAVTYVTMHAAGTLHPFESMRAKFGGKALRHAQQDTRRRACARQP